MRKYFLNRMGKESSYYLAQPVLHTGSQFPDVGARAYIAYLQAFP